MSVYQHETGPPSTGTMIESDCANSDSLAILLTEREQKVYQKVSLHLARVGLIDSVMIWPYVVQEEGQSLTTVALQLS